VKHYRLPWPPTVNGYWGTSKKGRKYLKTEGKLYRQAAIQAIGDVDNYWKGLLDAMTAAGRYLGAMLARFARASMRVGQWRSSSGHWLPVLMLF